MVAGGAETGGSQATDPSTASKNGDAGGEQRWPGWPGYNVYRMIVPVTTVGSIIGKKGDFIKKLCEETRARVRILDAPSATTPDRIVLISGKEEPEAEISPAMAAVLRVFKRINGLTDDIGDGKSTSESAICSVRLLMASLQAINLIGKQGTSIKAIQEGSGAVIRVTSEDNLPFYASPEERVVDIQGESINVQKALHAVVGHLRKFLVDHGVVALFEKTMNKPVIQEPSVVDAWSDRKQSLIHTAQQAGIGDDYALPLTRESLFLDREARLESQVGHSNLSLYGQESALAGSRTSGLARPAAGLITQITQTMQIPLIYAEDIIGSGGGNIAYIRRTSGAVLSIQESRASDEIVIEIKGTPNHVRIAQQLIEECLGGHKEPATSAYGSLDIVSRPTFSELAASTTYPSSSLTSQTFGGYGTAAGLGGGGGGGYGSYYSSRY